MKKKKKAAFDGSLPGSAATGALVLDGNVRAPLVIDFFFFFCSSENKQELQRYRETDPLQNLAAQCCNAASSKDH